MFRRTADLLSVSSHSDAGRDQRGSRGGFVGGGKSEGAGGEGTAGWGGVR